MTDFIVGLAFILLGVWHFKIWIELKLLRREYEAHRDNERHPYKGPDL